MRTVQVLYFQSRTWIMERSGQQCVLPSLFHWPDWAEREGDSWRVSAMSDHELLLECRWAAAQLLAAAQAIVICVCCSLQGRHLAAASPPISLGNAECIRSRSVIEFHTCHSQLNCVFFGGFFCWRGALKKMHSGEDEGWRWGKVSSSAHCC